MSRPTEACDRYFEGKHVLVTGGSEGLGYALAARAVRGGAAAVTLVARTRAKLDAATERLRLERRQQQGQGQQQDREPAATTLIQAFSADVTDAQALQAAVRAAEAAVAAANRTRGGSKTDDNDANNSAQYADSAHVVDPGGGGGGVDVLLACAGSAECGYFHGAAAGGAFGRQMQLNYMGVVHAVQAVYEGMVGRAGRLGRWRAAEGGRRRAGTHGRDSDPPPEPPRQQHILIVASAMSLLNFVGYAAYAPSKWALRGLAEGLRNELQGSGGRGGARGGGRGGGGGAGAGGPSGGGGGGGLLASVLPSFSSSPCSDVRVTIAFPPDVDTPGYAAESRTKPPECAEISRGSPLFSADAVARCAVRGMARGAFVAPNPSPVLALLQALSRGVVPASAGPFGWIGLPLEMVLGALGPLIASVAGAEHDGVARRLAPGRFGRLWG